MRSRRSSSWRARSDPVRGRRRALAEEVGYWEGWLSTGGGTWPGDFAYRFAADAEVEDSLLRALLGVMKNQAVSILDVGAGPVTTVGRRFDGAPLTVVAVDPLADEYNRLLAKAGRVPPVRTAQVPGERLLDHFGHDRFDIAYSRNALDHSIDPVPIIEQMLAVVRPGGYVVLRHARNEAIKESYVQLHQWNFDEREGQLVIWRVNHETNVSEALAGRAEVTCHREPGGRPDEAITPGDYGWVVCVIRKLG
jgi:SAM-dependent methyltransferase